MNRKYSEEKVALTLWMCTASAETGEKGYFMFYIYLVAVGQDGFSKRGTIYFAFDQKASMPEAFHSHIVAGFQKGERR